jgi:hypothetical protein
MELGLESGFRWLPIRQECGRPEAGLELEVDLISVIDVTIEPNRAKMSDAQGA